MLNRNMLFDRGDSETSFYMAEAAEAGILVAYPTSGTVSPPGLDDADNIAIVPTSTSDKPIGILMDTVKELTDSRYLPNETIREVLFDTANGVYPKVEIIRRGWFVTDQLHTGATAAPGAALYFAVGGLFTSASGSARVGTFESHEDADGFARIRLDV